MNRCCLLMVLIGSGVFLVGCGDDEAQWGATERLNPDDSFAPLQRAIASGAGGRVLVIWTPSGDLLSAETGANGFLARWYVPGAGWSAAERIDPARRRVLQTPSAAVDNEGNGIVVWGQPRDEFSRVVELWATRFTLGEGWSPPELVGSEVTYTRPPSVAFDPDGNALVVWRYRRPEPEVEGPWNLVANHYVRGQGWGTPEVLETNSILIDEFEGLGFDEEGNALVLWLERRALWANRYVPGRGWGTPESLEVDGGVGEEVVGVVDRQGTGWVLSAAGSVGGPCAGAARYTGDGWGAVVELGGENCVRPNLTVDGRGNAVATWSQRETPAAAFTSRYEAGAWSSPEPITAILVATESLNVPSVTVAPEPSGGAIAAWYQAPPSASDPFGLDRATWASRFDPSSGVWSDARLLGEAGWPGINLFDGRPPFLVVRGNGQAIVVWEGSLPSGGFGLYSSELK